MKWPASLTLVTKWRRLDDGGVEDIADWASSVSNPRLAVLDTLAGVRPERQARDTTYDGDYRALIELHRLSNEHHFSAMALHHTCKMEAEDTFDIKHPWADMRRHRLDSGAWFAGHFFICPWQGR